MSEPLVQLEGLRVGWHSGQDQPPVVLLADIDLRMEVGQRTAIVGESGSGKSMLALSLLGLLPGKLQCLSGQARWRNQVRPIGRQPLAPLGRELAMVFQDPSSALHPMWSIGQQLAEVWSLHVKGPQGESWLQGKRRIWHLLEQVGLQSVERLLQQYPHQLSGGMRQRVLLAMAMLTEPTLLIADEPTTALDAHHGAEVVRLLKQLAIAKQLAVLLISHDLHVVTAFAEQLLVMYAGRVVEVGASATLLSQAKHPYTQALLACGPKLTGPRLPALPTIAGTPASAKQAGPGCAFAPRCPLAMAKCHTQRPALLPLAPNHQAACHLLE